MLPFHFWWEQSVHSTKCVYTRHPIMITDIILILINQNCLLTYKANSPTSGSNDGVYYPCVLQRHAALQRSFKAVKMPNRQQQVGRHDEFAIYVKKNRWRRTARRETDTVDWSERASEWGNSAYSAAGTPSSSQQCGLTLLMFYQSTTARLHPRLWMPHANQWDTDSLYYCFDRLVYQFFSSCASPFIDSWKWCYKI